MLQAGPAQRCISGNVLFRIGMELSEQISSSLFSVHAIFIQLNSSIHSGNTWDWCWWRFSACTRLKTVQITPIFTISWYKWLHVELFPVPDYFPALFQLFRPLFVEFPVWQRAVHECPLLHCSAHSSGQPAAGVETSSPVSCTAAAAGLWNAWDCPALWGLCGPCLRRVVTKSAKPSAKPCSFLLEGLEM